MENKQMPTEVATSISNILKFMEKSESDFVADKLVDTNEEAEHENS